MSVVAQSSRGWVLDACSLIDQGYSRCARRTRDAKSHVRCCFKRQCFQILKSHGSVHARAAAVDAGNTEMLQKTNKPPKSNVKGEKSNEISRGLPKEADHIQQTECVKDLGLPANLRNDKRRKRKHSELNQGEIDAQVFHEKIRSVISEGTTSLLDSARSVGYLNGVTDAVEEPLPLQECGLAALCEMAKELPLVDDDEEEEECVQSLVDEDGCASHVDLFSRVTENGADRATVVSLMGGEYVIPAHAAFLLSDFTRMQPLLNYGRKFDLIVMDPPWENKSVKRSRRYGSLPSSQLKQLPINLLASADCLVVTWVTNRPSHLRCVRDELYPHWGVEVVAEWYWVKVTTSGQFVFPLDSQHKKPYEVLVLGRYRPSADHSASSSYVPVEDSRLIVSVPSALHSQKPSLSEILRRYVGAEASCLELFARSLQPGWTSWGNEVLKFQHTSYFTVSPADDPANISGDEDPQLL